MIGRLPGIQQSALMKSLQLLLLLLLLWRDTLAIASDEAEQFRQLLYNEDSLNTTNSTNSTAAPDVTVEDDAFYTPHQLSLCSRPLHSEEEGIREHVTQSGSPWNR